MQQTRSTDTNRRNIFPEDISQLARTAEDSDIVYRSVGVPSLASIQSLASLAPPTLQRSGDWRVGSAQVHDMWASKEASPLAAVPASLKTLQRENDEAPSVPRLYRLEKTCFTVQRPAKALLDDVSCLLKGASIAVQEGAEPFSLVCSFFCCQTLVKFHVQLFKAPEGQGVLCEFQRRQGCCLVFCTLFKGVSKRIMEGNSSLSSGEALREEVKSAVCPPRPPFLANNEPAVPPVSVAKPTPEEMDVFADMISSSSVDRCLEGIRAVALLAEIKGGSCAGDVLAHEGIVRAFTKVLTSPPTPVVRCSALSAIAALAQNAPHLELTGAQSQWIKGVVEGIKAHCPHTQREGLKGLARLLEVGGAPLLERERETVENLLLRRCSTDDPCASRMARECLSIIHKPLVV